MTEQARNHLIVLIVALAGGAVGFVIGQPNEESAAGSYDTHLKLLETKAETRIEKAKQENEAAVAEVLREQNAPRPRQAAKPTTYQQPRLASLEIETPEYRTVLGEPTSSSSKRMTFSWRANVSNSGDLQYGGVVKFVFRDHNMKSVASDSVAVSLAGGESQVLRGMVTLYDEEARTISKVTAHDCQAGECY